MSSLFDSDIVQVQVTDKDGKELNLSKIVSEDYFLAAIPGYNVLKEFKTFAAYTDDIIICGYGKCGTHWVWEIANMLVSGSSDYIPCVKETTMFELIPDFEALKTVPRPRVLNSHLPPRILPPDILVKGCKLVYLLRNPKDVAVSFYNHVYKLRLMYNYDGTWDAFLDLFMRGQIEGGNIFEYVEEWDAHIKDHSVHIIYYEDIKKDSAKEIRRLAQYLNLDIKDELVQDIAYKTDFARMKSAKDGLEPDELKQLWLNNTPDMYRKGEVDDWKNWFTVKQNEQFDAMFSGEMKGSLLRYATHTAKA